MPLLRAPEGMKVHPLQHNRLYCRAQRVIQQEQGKQVGALEIIELDARGLECPMPLLKAKRALNTMAAGQRLRVLATDQGSLRDFRVFAEQSGHLLLSSEESEGVYTHLLQKS